MDRTWLWLGALVIVSLLSLLASQKARAAKDKFLAHHPVLSFADLSPEVQTCIREGQRIAALKQFRKETALGLKDAKDILDRITL